jgi:hypothetical protein
VWINIVSKEKIVFAQQIQFTSKLQQLYELHIVKLAVTQIKPKCSGSGDSKGYM